MNDKRRAGRVREIYLVDPLEAGIGDIPIGGRRFFGIAAVVDCNALHCDLAMLYEGRALKGTMIDAADKSADKNGDSGLGFDVSDEGNRVRYRLGGRRHCEEESDH